ncbi:4-(cytidine 5'-diphospho)-2-C-methyl-D-erythritol kinase [Sphingosinicella sp. CPCC 101087]|uniref:4-(cytidine 5'-diphospho)-2-C-methyl-D-erythritol kinase n=1 Tax=Sphingosinicella sp. CPCC 101087 TaxID=2497754 RepID=UPI00101CFFB5|nr:4-(cytidine 5'-diphospho)-2-C-methyl-D-erythritol kinase [Sphingosinicella sp. CPCC 101087]
MPERYETAFAKLNLALHVRGRMADGYHRIETVFAFVEDGDRLTVTGSDQLELAIEGPFAADLAGQDDNLVLRAARALRGRYAVPRGARLTLEKRLPVASGIGGGSADAAAALRLLARFWELPTDEADLIEIAASLGADVPACVPSRSAWGEGRGDALRPLSDDALPRTSVLLVNPRRALSTAAVFRAWDGVDRGPLTAWRDGRNDLQPAAVALIPEIAEVLEALGGADFARMSGSGATCFGFYEDEARRNSAAAAIADARPDWWLMRSRLRPD